MQDRGWKFELCAMVNKWDAAKQLLCLPIYESLSNAGKEVNGKLKKAILDRLDLDTEKHTLAAWDQLTHRRF